MMLCAGHNISIEYTVDSILCYGTNMKMFSPTLKNDEKTKESTDER